MESNLTPRLLSHDEKKAAEAAFAGRPFNPIWSQSAKLVYEGLTRALPPVIEEHVAFPSIEAHAAEESSVNEAAPPAATNSIHESHVLEQIDVPSTGTAETTKQVITNRQEAIQAGVLIDVTPEAQKLGLTFPVTVTRPLWEAGIAPNQTLSDEEKANRLRDVLMAFRLRMASLVTLSPLIDFPAILALPPGTVPQPVPLFALIQPDAKDQATVTLLLPNEVSTTINPMN
jgi:hypothetical protein